jgi:hypothetical protein
LTVLALACTGCAVHSPERAAREFIRQVSTPAPPTGSAAFDRTRQALQLADTPTKREGVPYRSAAWVRKQQRLGLVTSNVLVDDPQRYDLRLSWTPSRLLRSGLMERTLGPPTGISATGDSAWVLPAGGVLEYRHVGIETPYLLYSSPGYIREPLDFVETPNAPKLPALSDAAARLRALAGPDFTERSEVGFRGRRSCFDAGTCVTLYVASMRGQPDYLIGLEVAIKPSPPADAFVRVFQQLGVPDAGKLIAAISGRPFAAESNLALARPEPERIILWRRIESPLDWCKHLRPDLARCQER